jgi:hypothetical protein
VELGQRSVAEAAQEEKRGTPGSDMGRGAGRVGRGGLLGRPKEQ